MASKQRADKQKEKEKREKIILAGLVGVLVIVGALELPKMLKKSPGSTAAQTTSISTSPGVTSGGTAAPGPGTVGALPDPTSYEAGAGQLNGFSLFNSRDPFGNSATNSSETTPTPTTTNQTSSTRRTTITTRGSFVGAKISISGVDEAVLVNGTFPSSSFAFVLRSVSAAQIQISVNGGSFASGQAKVTVKKGKSVVLVNTVDSMRYVIKYIAPLTAKQVASFISATTTGTTTSLTTSSSTTTTTSSTTTATTSSTTTATTTH